MASFTLKSNFNSKCINRDTVSRYDG